MVRGNVFEGGATDWRSKNEIAPIDYAYLAMKKLGHVIEKREASWRIKERDCFD